MWTKDLFSDYLYLWLLVSLTIAATDWRGQPWKGRLWEELGPCGLHWVADAVRRSPPYLELWICDVKNFPVFKPFVWIFHYLQQKASWMMGRSSGSSMGTKVSLSCWEISSHRAHGQQHHVSYLTGLGLPVSLKLKDGVEAAGGGLDTYSWEGVENDPDQTINSEFFFWAFNLHWNGKAVTYWFIYFSPAYVLHYVLLS